MGVDLHTFGWALVPLNPEFVLPNVVLAPTPMLVPRRASSKVLTQGRHLNHHQTRNTKYFVRSFLAADTANFH